jgi:phage terminase small subunit
MTPKVIRKRTRAQKEFIRAREHLTPRETLAEAKQAGLRLSINQIYSQRTIDVRNAVLAGERAAKPRARASRPAKQASADAERQLRVAVAKLGLDRARDIIDELERAVLKR